MTGSTIMMTCSFEDLKQMIREVIQEFKTESSHKPDKPLLTREEVCKLLHIGSTKLSKITKLGVIQGYRIGRRVLYKESEVMDALQEMPNRQKWQKQMEDDEDLD